MGIVPASVPRTGLAVDRPDTRPADAAAAEEGIEPLLEFMEGSEPLGESVLDNPAPRNWLVKTKAVSASREGEPPIYVRPLSESGLPGTEQYDWVDFGIEHRSRFEYRDDNRIRNLSTDYFFFLRSRGYVGIREIADPLRFGIEFMDSRQFGSADPTRDQDVNENDILQAFVELYFKDAAGPDQPISLRMGRMATDYIDRRLLTRNGFRNTINAFDGGRLRFGHDHSRWQTDLLFLMPVERRLTRMDHTDRRRFVFGAIGNWRGWSEYITIEPYYIVLNDRANERILHTTGAHVYGPIAGTRFDYDVHTSFQFGRNQGRQHRAFAFHAELGYSFDHPWRPRVAGWIDYASGDRRPGSSKSTRFDSLFGSSHTMYGYSDLVPWQNMIGPTLYFRLRPTPKLDIEAFYRVLYLASKKDAFIRGGIQDPTGGSGRFAAQQLDLRVAYDLTDKTQLEVGYAHFLPGTFVRKAGNGGDSDFFYVQIVTRF